MKATPLIILALFAAGAHAQTDTLVASAKLNAGGRVNIRNLDGQIRFRPGNGDRVEVRAHLDPRRGGDPRDIGFVTSTDAAEVRVCTTWQGNGCDGQGSTRDIRVSVSYTVSLPRGSAVIGATGNGDIEVEQVVATANLRTGNGDLHVTDATDLDAFTGNGDIVVSSAAGTVRLRTGNGDIQFKGHPVDIDANSGNGDVVATIAGHASAARRFTLVTGSGDVKVSLPADIAGELDAQSGSGEITSAFDVHADGRVTSGRLRGTIGNGAGASIRLRTGSGQVTISRGS